MRRPARNDARMSSDLLIRYGGPFAPGLVRSASASFIEMEDGSRVLDFTAGQICATIGHNHPRVVEAIERSCREVMHLNSWSLSPPVISLAERLIGTLPEPLERAMFLSTGGEANEAALRMAKLASGKFEVVALTRSWHGVTAGASAHTHAGGRRGTRRARALGRRRDRAASGLLRAHGGAVLRARHDARARRVPDRPRPAGQHVRVRALRRGAGLPR